MANTAKFNTRVIQKHDIEANWLKATGFIPLEGEVIIYDAEVAGDELPAGREERITHARMKIGDGVTLVSNLEFVNKYADVATLAGYAGMAEQDGEGHNIVATYATKSEISGVESQIAAIDNTIGAMDVSAPSSTTGNATTFVDSITQTDGKISYTTKAIPVATTTTAGFIPPEDVSKLDYTNIAYGTCTTAAGTAAKVITISGNTNWELKAGSIITIYFSYTNTATSPTFNVGGTGAKNIYFQGSRISSSSNAKYAGYASTPCTYVYDGTQYRFIGWGKDDDTNTTYTNASLGQGYGTCATAAATTAKVVTMSNYTLSTGGIVSVKFTYANTASNATMNINSKGAKNIRYKNSNIASNVIQAGDTATFIYDGSYYHLLAIDRWGSDYVPSSRTVNGKALSSNITLSATDVGAYTKAEIDDYEFITVDDIDTICGAMIQVASANDRSVTF